MGGIEWQGSDDSRPFAFSSFCFVRDADDAVGFLGLSIVLFADATIDRFVALWAHTAKVGGIYDIVLFVVHYKGASR